MSPDWGTGTNYILQLTGLGGLKPNTVMLSWPTGWRKKVDRARDFVNVMCTATNEDMCVVVGKEFITMFFPSFILIFCKFVANFERLVLGCINAKFCK